MNERPDIKQIKAELAAAIVRLIDEQQLTDMAASERLTLAPTEIARIRAGDLADFSIDHMIAVLNAFEQHVHVNISPNTAEERATKSGAKEHPATGNALLSIVQYMEELNAKIPPEELEKLPTDFAANHDYYLYGAPKRD
jgi:predicted XRE-type DNA-binding protein